MSKRRTVRERIMCEREAAAALDHPGGGGEEEALGGDIKAAAGEGGAAPTNRATARLIGRRGVCPRKPDMRLRRLGIHERVAG